MGEDSGAALLRMVRYKGIKQDADRLRDPTQQDAFEALARTIHMGDTLTANQALQAWIAGQIRELRANPRSTRTDKANLSAVYYEMKGKIQGRALLMNTELGYYSQNVGPEYGKITYYYKSWATRDQLVHLFDEGNELVLQGHVGTGKSHLAVLFMEALLQLASPRFTVICNIPGIHDRTNKYTQRLHHVTLLSEILRIWSTLPEEARIYLVLDEPEANLRGGHTKSVNTFMDFRYMIRKLGIAKLEIWHTEGEQYKAIREERSEKLFRIKKDDKATFTLESLVRDATVTQRVESVPPLAFLGFAHRGMGSIDVDVNMNLLIRRLAKLHEVPEMKRAVRESLSDSRYFLPEYRNDMEPRRRRRKASKDDGVIQAILANPDRYLGARGSNFDRHKVRRAFRLTTRDAERLAHDAWQRQTVKDPPAPSKPARRPT